MRGISRYPIAGLLAAAFLCGAGSGPDLNQADQFFEKGLFEEALKVYEAVYEEADETEARDKAALRIVECLVFLFRYGEAAERVLSTEVPGQWPYRAHFLILKADILRNFQRVYRRIQPADVIDEEEKEVFRLTPEEIRPEIVGAFEALWGLREDLLYMDLKREGTFMDTEDTDLARYPTLFDYVILGWTGFLLEEAGSNEAPPIGAEVLLAADFTWEVNLTDAPALLAAELMEESSRLTGTGRQEARERWKIQRLLLPVRHSNLFSFDDVHRDKEKIPSGIDAYKDRAKEILLRWMDSFSTDEARAEAGHEAARVLYGQKRLIEVVDLCKQIEQKFRGTYGARLAEVLRARIELPELSLKARTVLPPGAGAFTVTTKNVKEVFFKAYRVDPHELRKQLIALRDEYRYNGFYTFRGWSDVFDMRWYGHDWADAWLEGYLSREEPYVSWSIETGDKGDYRQTSTDVDPPDLGAGVYLVVGCGDEAFKVESSLMSACLLNVTELLLIGTSGFTTKALDAYNRCIEDGKCSRVTDEGFRFYAMDARSGEPARDAELNVYWYEKNGRSVDSGNLDLLTGDDGVAPFDVETEVAPGHMQRHGVDPLGQLGNSYSYWSDELAVAHPSPNPLHMFIETDRPIYKPGDQVKVKVVVVKKSSQGFKTLSGKHRATITCRDANRKEFFDESVSLNEFGSASVSIEIPHGRLLGRYTVEARSSDGRYKTGNMTGFSVEEYKRPEFEIELGPAEGPWKYNEPADIKGTASYYFGGPVPEATIKYRIKRADYIPYYYRYWFPPEWSDPDREVARGEVTTDVQGEFVITFTPQPSGPRKYSGYVPSISRFSVEVEGQDAGGRTIEAARAYKAGESPIYLVIEPRKGFFLEAEEIEIGSKCLTVNDTPAPGEGVSEIFQLADVAVEELPDYDKWKSGGYRTWIPPLDAQLKDVPNGELVARGNVEYGEDGSGSFTVRPLPRGAYRIIVKSEDDWGETVEQKKIMVVAKDTETPVPLIAYSVTLVERDAYETGETARFVIGSGLGSGTYHIEIRAGDHLVTRELVRGDGLVRLLEVPVTGRMKGGFTLHWFGAKDLVVHFGRETVSVPWTDKKLNVMLDPFDEVLEPGHEYEWGIRLTDWMERPVKGEALALMFDRSLEYYVKNRTYWLDNLYLLRPSHLRWSPPVYDIRVHRLHATEGWIHDLFKASRETPRPLMPPMLRTARAWRAAGRFYQWGDMEVRYRSIETLDEAVLMMPSVPLDAEAIHIRGGREGELPFALEATAGFTSKAREAAAEVKARERFLDTGFFEPHIVTSGADGRGRFTFAAPEQLTAWKVMVFAFTKDVKEGMLTEEVLTRKRLMVRADIPRFFREKDRGTITATVHNEAEETLEGELFIDVLEDGRNINDVLRLTDAGKRFRIEPHGMESFDWLIEIPQGVSTYKVRVAAVAGELSDAEERDLPILPSRQRLIESDFVALSGSETKTLDIPAKDDPTRISESMVLRVDPQLALSILNVLPFLVEYPYECVEQILNRYVPLSIVNEIYKKYPSIREAVAKIPKRTTVTPPWKKDDPMRQLELMETPWIWQSEGRPMMWPITDLLDPEIVKMQKEISLAKLKEAQLANGAFPWWPGGRPSPYITLYVLAGFAEARRHGVEVPGDVVARALRYVNSEIPKQLEPDEGNLALVSFAAYVVTSYSPDEYPEAREGHKAAESWVKFLDKNVHAMTAFAKAYLAYTHHNLGNRKRAGEVLDMAMDGAREDPLVGVYWTPEKYSWVWYSDTVEKHAFLLKTLQQLRPGDERIPGMVRWLLFNRKGNVWKSTKASAAAVFALLDYMGNVGALTEDETFKARWGARTYTAVVKPDDWLEEPLTWEEKGFEITPDMNAATIEKEGPGVAFASLTWTYSTDELPEASQPGILELERKFYKRVREEDAYHLKPLESGGSVAVGDQIEVRIKINTRSQFEYMHLIDPKAAGFEAERLLSGWTRDPLWYYEEPRHSLTNFFMSSLPHGEYILRYRLRPTKPGVYRVGAATLQSMYAPEMAAHSSGMIIKVVP